MEEHGLVFTQVLISMACGMRLGKEPEDGVSESEMNDESESGE